MLSRVQWLLRCGLHTVTMALYFVLMLFSVLILLSLCFRFSYGGRLIHKIPGPKTLPIFGNTFNLVMKPAVLFKFLRSLHNEYGRLSKLQAFHLRAINVYEPADIEVILSQVKFNEKWLPYNFMKAWLGEGLLVNNGSKWHHRRKLLTPAFHFNILRKFCRTFSEQTDEFLKQIQKETGSEKTDLMPLISKQTLRIMCETSLGTTMDEDIELVTNRYFQGLFVIGKCIVYRLTRTWLYLDFMFNLTKAAIVQKIAVKDLHKFTTDIIQQRREYVEMNQIENWDGHDDIYGKKSRLAMLDMLLDQEKKGKIDEEGIREEVDTFLFEGHDTTATALCFMIMRIANEPKIQELIYEEQQRIFCDSDRTPTIEDLAAMKYLECSIKESLRLYPSVPFIARHITEDVELGGFLVPGDTVCNIHIFDVHRRADLYPEPEKFIPERFLPENIAARHPYAYIPFSAGPRNCIGQKFAILEMKTVMSGLLRKFKVEPVTKPEDLMFTCDIVLRTENPIYVRFKKRNMIVSVHVRTHGVEVSVWTT